MKKIFTLTLITLTISLHAQYTPVRGDIGLGLDATGPLNYLGRMFTSNNSFSLSPTNGYASPFGFYARKFTKDNQALRAAVNLNYENTSKLSGSVETTTLKNNVQIGLGKEWRKGTGRIQGFYGAMVNLGYIGGSVNAVTTNPFNNTSTFVKNIQGNIMYFGLSGFLGAEYFIAPKLGLGAEFNYGLTYAMEGKSSRETNSSTTENKDGGSTIQLGGSSYAPSIVLNLYF